MSENTKEIKHLKLSLLLLRLGIFIVFFVWTMDKFFKPEHAVKVFSKFYFIDGLSLNMAYIIGTIQLLVVIAFLLGLMKRYSYGLLLLMHLVSTVTPFVKYFDPFSNLLFFAAWPMLAALIALYLLREHDTLFNFKRKL